MMATLDGKLLRNADAATFSVSAGGVPADTYGRSTWTSRQSCGRRVPCSAPRLELTFGPRRWHCWSKHCGRAVKFWLRSGDALRLAIFDLIVHEHARIFRAARGWCISGSYSTPEILEVETDDACHSVAPVARHCDPSMPSTASYTPVAPELYLKRLCGGFGGS